MSLAFALQSESRIVRPAFVHRGAIEIGEPGLDVPGGDEHGDAFVLFAALVSHGTAGFLKLFQSSIHAFYVSVHHDDEGLVHGA